MRNSDIQIAMQSASKKSVRLESICLSVVTRMPSPPAKSRSRRIGGWRKWKTILDVNYQHRDIYVALLVMFVARMIVRFMLVAIRRFSKGFSAVGDLRVQFGNESRGIGINLFNAWRTANKDLATVDNR